jgi:hypothetical protein
VGPSQGEAATAGVTPSGRVCYTEPITQQPQCTLASTGDDGLVWIFAVPAGVAAVSGRLADTVQVRSRQVRVEASLLIQIGLEP